MNNVWRIGSNWGGESLIDIFKQAKIAFAGDEVQNQMRNVEAGDLLAITDGQQIIAIGNIACVTDLQKEGIRGTEDFGDRVGLKLNPLFWRNAGDDWMDYAGQGKQFHRARGSYEDEIVAIFKKKNNLMMKNEIKDLVEANKQIVLTGAPGTGKTYLARELAAKLIGCDSPDDLTSSFSNQFKFVQFHPAYDYTDFVEGLKPHPGENGQIGFKAKNGIFMEFCKAADDSWEEGLDPESQKKFVFVIDEINRADLSRVFGELFYALEPDYRGPKGAVKTQYSSLYDVPQPDFYVPKNIYIIGTMNDIDRSVESIDFALRRRFAWYEVKADEDRFDQVMANLLKPEETKEAKARYSRINDLIKKENSLGEAYCIGPAYFRKLANYSGEEGDDIKWDEFWKYHLAPLVKEYVRGMSGADKIAAEIEDAFRGTSSKI